jgi:hypothetical protein
VEAFGELVGDADGGEAAAAGGVADFYKAGGGMLWNAEGEARGAAHEDVGGLAIDEHGGRAEAERPEVDADELDFAVGQGGGGDHVVNAGIGECFRGGM